ncbi:protein of unknown function DUF4050 [Cynara cardunculus var. scolymus]|uniref:Gag1-like clamp domain-containing protein n=1 Tax=Cynara cardunculus var. scolymus TaxID=59895 RepID=A0A103XZJ8_CYNCS|nr:protein of unknown function DUF4050 [Cynara cardunculus var. scolymus]
MANGFAAAEITIATMFFERLVGKSFFCLVSETYCALMHWVMENLKDKLRSLFHSRGCLGCPKVPFMTTGKKTTGASKNDSATNKASMVQDFWSSSTYEMDNSAAQSQLSASSVSLSNPTLDGHCSSGSNPPEFVNRGIWKATYDNLLGTNKPFPRPVPLREMVNFLVDVWEEEGLYD